MATAPATRGDRILLGRVVAAIELLGRTGVSDVEFAYDEEDAYPNKVLWWAKGNWKGHRVYSAHFPYPAQALEDVLSRVINGGTCGRCGRTTVVGVLLDGEYCCFTLTAQDVDDDQGYAYVRTCEAASTRGPNRAERRRRR
jgi:hypothetical protein